MQGWSRMAALSIVAGWCLMVGAADRTIAEDAKGQETAKAKGQVDLHLVITGVKSDRTEVEVGPGSGGTSFEVRKLKVSSNPVGGEVGLVELWVRNMEVSTSGADRECSVGITVKEPGQPERFTRRGFRLSNNAAAKSQRVDYYISSTALAAKVIDDTRKTK